MKKTIDLLRQQQNATRGASEWVMLEEEIQSLLDEEEVENCYQGKFWDHLTNTFIRWNELINTSPSNEKIDG
tara:strand:- start:11 stop:226 length:216 start_codon:yes stop_codon:yes gene_type:complete